MRNFVSWYRCKYARDIHVHDDHDDDDDNDDGDDDEDNKDDDDEEDHDSRNTFRSVPLF